MSAGRARVRPGNYSQIRIRERKLPPLAPSKNEEKAPSVRQRAQSVPCNASEGEQLVPGKRVRSEGFIALSVSASSIYVCVRTQTIAPAAKNSQRHKKSIGKKCRLETKGGSDRQNNP
jgi:hypothetical protein